MLYYFLNRTKTILFYAAAALKTTSEVYFCLGLWQMLSLRGKRDGKHFQLFYYVLVESMVFSKYLKGGKVGENIIENNLKRV